MIITVEIKNVILRNGTFHFRLAVPTDCQKALRRKTIYQSLKTDDPLIAEKSATELGIHWKAKFEKIRQNKPTKQLVKAKRKVKLVPLPDDELKTFRDELSANLEKNLPKILEQNDDDELRELSDHYRDLASMFCKGHPMLNKGVYDSDLPEFGLTGRWKNTQPAGVERRRRRAVAQILDTARKLIDEELGEAYSLQHGHTEPIIEPRQVLKENAGTDNRQKDTAPDNPGIIEIAEEMLMAKDRIVKTQYSVRADIKDLVDWAGVHSIKDFTRQVLIDYIRNGLPYIPPNMSRNKAYHGKSIKQVIEMAKADPGNNKTIAYQTCKNKLENLQMVFNYAKNQCGLIAMNPASNIEIPKLHAAEDLPRGFTPDELVNFWSAINTVKETDETHPARYWVPILALYHGMRVNEICSLFLKDVYEDTDGVLIMDINAVGENKSVKNKSSIRLVPVHPFVMYELGFQSYISQQKDHREEGLLFPDLKFYINGGYRGRVSNWFRAWKKTWLPKESTHKHWHDFRYTFIQTSQNIAKISDRCAHEITGHETPGVSSVHLGYSGRLKPAALLEELQKLRYGWE